MHSPGRWLRDSADWLPDGAADVHARLVPRVSEGDRAGARPVRTRAPLGERPVVRAGFIRVSQTQPVPS
jgi:hypothetical protein